jgi:hypothetical protein
VGIHFRRACNAGYDQGLNVGATAVQRFRARR